VRNLLVIAVAGLCGIVVACGGAVAPTHEPAASEVAVQAAAEGSVGAPDEAVADVVPTERHDVVYVCNCGPACDCNTVSTTAGKCSCGKDLVSAHLVKVEGDEGLLCMCGKDCTCTVDANDPAKCACGKDLRRISFKGTGLYYCNCGGSCTCNHVSDKPGTCTCGMELKQSV
jgi:hypothetical protein